MKIKLWIISLFLLIAGIILCITTNELFFSLFTLGFLLIISGLILIIINVTKLKKGISIPAIIISSIAIIFLLMFLLANLILYTGGHWGCEQPFICVLPTTNIPCTSAVDCGIRPLQSICDATTLTCSNYSDSTVPNRKECIAAGGSWKKTSCYIM